MRYMLTAARINFAPHWKIQFRQYLIGSFGEHIPMKKYTTYISPIKFKQLWFPYNNHIMQHDKYVQIFKGNVKNQ